MQVLMVGEHGTSDVPLSSSAAVAGCWDIPGCQGQPVTEIRTQVENEIRYANRIIIGGIGASQYGMGAVVARLTETFLKDQPTT